SVEIDRTTIAASIPKVIAFTQAAMAVSNHYLWGGTVAPNYDCSGLMQAAFASQGIWLPRDSYQQEAFVEPVSIEQMLPGDLIFFGTPEKTDHVALHLGELRYIHSSGIQMGRNGIGIDILTDRTTDPVSAGYYAKFRCCGRIMNSYSGR
ncbi:C40 family peptidase, partial [Chamaesiphon sp. OTE_8_metabat_110]|uniref:C40 family peptidase n=1 Tax=Chamaesiphon sp. OTE_8_metabat_110 TaxID=2964696 RepID=UPI00286A0639